jgi:hypothetical protein
MMFYVNVCVSEEKDIADIYWKQSQHIFRYSSIFVGCLYFTLVSFSGLHHGH